MSSGRLFSSGTGKRLIGFSDMKTPLCINQFDFSDPDELSEVSSKLDGPTIQELEDIEIEEALDELTDPDKSETIH